MQSDLHVPGPSPPQVYRRGLLPLKDMNALLGVVDCSDVRSVVQDQARHVVGRGAAALRGLLHASDVAAGAIRMLVWEAEASGCDACCMQGRAGRWPLACFSRLPCCPPCPGCPPSPAPRLD